MTEEEKKQLLERCNGECRTAPDHFICRKINLCVRFGKTFKEHCDDLDESKDKS